MSDQPDDQPTDRATERAAPGPPPVGEGTDVPAGDGDVDVSDGDQDEPPATSDPDAYVEDATLGGTGGRSPGGAG